MIIFDWLQHKHLHVVCTYMYIHKSLFITNISEPQSQTNVIVVFRHLEALLCYQLFMIVLQIFLEIKCCSGNLARMSPNIWSKANHKGKKDLLFMWNSFDVRNDVPRSKIWAHEHEIPFAFSECFLRLAAEEKDHPVSRRTCDVNMLMRRKEPLN